MTENIKNTSNENSTAKETTTATDKKTNVTNTAGTLCYLPIDELKNFREHPFKTYEGEQLKNFVASIAESGVLVPIIVRPNRLKAIPGRNAVDFGNYEILSGHNRIKAAKQLNHKNIRAEIRDVDDEKAIEIVNKTNLQQRSFEKWLPSEKSESIAQYHESIKRQGVHPDASSEVREKWDSQAKAANIYGVKKNIIEKYLNLNRLIKPLKERLDKKEFKEIPAKNIAHLSEDEQKTVNSFLSSGRYTLTLDNSKKIRKLSKSGEFDIESVEDILKEDNGGVRSKVYTVKFSIISKYFPDVPPESIESELIKALELYKAQSKSNEYDDSASEYSPD